MGYGYGRILNSFDAVRNWYERTKPVVSYTHKLEDDIRPIGKRSRKWERIEKINNNCYALLGGYTECYVSYYGQRDVSERVTGAELKRIAPIVWERDPKTGEEFVTIHNARSGYATGLYEFFRRALPGPLYMSNTRDGRHYITGYGHTYYLPHNGYAPKPTREKYYRAGSKEQRDAGRPSSERKLVFKRVDDRFELVSTPYELLRKSKVVVDCEEKRPLRAEIREFKNYVMTMAPVFSDLGRAEMVAQVDEILTGVMGRKIHSYGSWWAALEMDPQTTRTALTDPESPLRLALVYGFLTYSRSCDRYLPYNCEAAPDLVKSRLNSFVNAAFGFSKPNK